MIKFSNFNLPMKKILSILAFIFITPISFGQSTETDAQKNGDTQLPQAPNCNIPAITRNYGTIAPSTQSIEISTKSNIGKPQQEGSVLFYAEFKNAEKYYYPKEDIEIKNSSPFNPSLILKNGEPQWVSGTFVSNEDNRTYDIISGRYAAILVNEDGFICKEGYSTKDWSTNSIWSWNTSPHNAMTDSIKQSPQQKSKNETKAIAIQVLKFDELQTTIQISKIIDENIVDSKKILVNSIKGSANIFDMKLKFHIQDKIFFLDELATPKNYNATLYKAFGRS